jgi:hypothetical protein
VYTSWERQEVHALHRLGNLKGRDHLQDVVGRRCEDNIRTAGNFSLHHRVQTGSGAQPASYPMGTRGSFSGGKAAGT